MNSLTRSAKYIRRENKNLGLGAGIAFKHRIDLMKAGPWQSSFKALEKTMKGWPVELKKVEAAFDGSIQVGEKGKPSASVTGQFGVPQQTGLKVDAKLFEKKAAEHPKIGASSTPSVSAKGSWELTGGKTELSATVAANALGYLLEGKLVVGAIKWDEKTLNDNGGQPVGELLQGELTGSFPLGFSYTADDGSTYSFNGRVGILFRFGPNWSAILEKVVESFGTDAIVAAVPYAAAAGIAVLVYVGYLDASRATQIRSKARAVANGVVQAGNSYGGVMTGMLQPGGQWGNEASKQAERDLAALVSQKGMTIGEWNTVLEKSGKKEEFFRDISAAYSKGALEEYRERTRKSIAEWHSDHLIQTILSGHYTDDDMAIVDAEIDRALATGGMPTAG